MTGSLTRDELRRLFLFEALEDPQLDRLRAAGRVRAYDAGAVIAREGEPAEHFVVLLEGRIRMSRRMGGEDVVVIDTDHRGAYGGATRAYVSLEEPYAATITASAPARVFTLPGAEFAAFVRDTFPMAVHLLDGLYVGIRNSEAQMRQREHLAQLGTLSANLAHELNNPAAAAVRATSQLRSRVAGMRHKLGLLAGGTIPAEALQGLVRLQEQAVERVAKNPSALSPVERADLEDAVADRLAELGIAGGYEPAAVFAAVGLDVAWVDDVVACIDRDLSAHGDVSLREGAVRWLAYTLETESLMDELEDASTRISTLVAAVKQYSRMDGATQDVVDLHVGLDSTIVMLGAKLGGVEVRREYDRDLPRVPGYPAELNQVWTNLLDNAAYALSGRGSVAVRTRREGADAVVEIADDGPGIPPEVLPRIFDAWYTTKPSGDGSGLGLDNARRVVERRHGGRIDVETSDRGTTFTVRLPLERP